MSTLNGSCDAFGCADNSFKTHRSRTTSDAAHFQVPAVSLLQDVPNIETVTHSLDAPRTSPAVENALKRKSACLATDMPLWHRPDLLDAEPDLFAVENALKRKSACLSTDVPQWHRPDLLDAEPLKSACLTTDMPQWLRSDLPDAEPDLFDFIDATFDESEILLGCSAPAC